MSLKVLIKNSSIFPYLVYLRYWIQRYIIKREFSSYKLEEGVTIEPVDDGITFFGYYNISPSNSNGVILYLKVNQENARGSLVEPASIMLKNANGAISKITETKAWNWQQGCMLQWHPSNNNQIIFGVPFALREDYLTLYGIKAADKVLTQSENQKAVFRENLNIESEIVKNYHKIPGEEINKAEPPVVLWLASIKKWKQPEVFLNASRALKDLNCRFILAGRMTDESYRAEITAWKDENDKFEYIEDVDFDKSNQLIAEASVFVNTSLKNEGFPNTFIQSWFRKTPTITLNFDPDGIIRNNNLGKHSGSQNRLIMDVKEIILDTDYRTKISETAYQYALTNYSKKDSFLKLLKIIEEYTHG
jgi:glycosyltransferase involved in cell wall biosynthesis